VLFPPRRPSELECLDDEPYDGNRRSYDGVRLRLGDEVPWTALASWTGGSHAH
jgi:hypothetical protein